MAVNREVAAELVVYGGLDCVKLVPGWYPGLTGFMDRARALSNRAVQRRCQRSGGSPSTARPGERTQIARRHRHARLPKRCTHFDMWSASVHEIADELLGRWGKECRSRLPGRARDRAQPAHTRRPSRWFVRARLNDGAPGPFFGASGPWMRWVSLVRLLQIELSKNQEQPMRLIGKRLLAAAGAIAVLAGLCIAGLATSASASTQVLHAGRGDRAHQCTLIGPADSFSDEAVVCVDMNTSLSPSGNPVVNAYAELLCQLPDGETRRCAQANSYGALSSATGGVGYRYQSSCSGNGCSTGRNVWFIGQMTFSSSNCTSLSNNAWAVLYGQNSQTSIQVASYDPLELLGSPYANDSGNESTGHYQICP